MMRALFRAAVGVLLAGALSPASAEAPAMAPDFAFIAGDRVAAHVGDLLTVLVVESSQAASSSNASNRRDGAIEAIATDGRQPRAPARANLDSRFDGAGRRAIRGALAAQIGVTVVGIRANGDLDVAGEQLLKIDGERTRIRLKGRVRAADIGADNTVLSSRMSDVTVSYANSGFSSRSARPGLAGRVLSWLGLL